MQFTYMHAIELVLAIHLNALYVFNHSSYYKLYILNHLLDICFGILVSRLCVLRDDVFIIYYLYRQVNIL